MIKKDPLVTNKEIISTIPLNVCEKTLASYLKSEGICPLQVGSNRTACHALWRRWYSAVTNAGNFKSLHVHNSEVYTAQYIGVHRLVFVFESAYASFMHIKLYKAVIKQSNIDSIDISAYRAFLHRSVSDIFTVIIHWHPFKNIHSLILI